MAGGILDWLPLVGMLVEGAGAFIVTVDLLPEFNLYRGRRRLGALTADLEKLVRAGQDALRTADDPAFGYSISPIEQYHPEMVAQYLGATPSFNLEGLQRRVAAVERAFQPFRPVEPMPPDVAGIFKRFRNLYFELQHDSISVTDKRQPLILGIALLVGGFLLQFVAAVPWRLFAPPS